MFRQFSSRRGKKHMLKITITNVPNDMTDKAIVSRICDKDALKLVI